MANEIYLSSFPLWLSAQKVTPPSAPENIIKHPLITNHLQRYFEIPLSIVSAPSGFGKTTTLADWYHSLNKNGVKVCWLSFDHTIKTPSMFASYILYSLHKANININANNITDFSILQTLSLEKLLALIVHTIEVFGDQIVLIIDNFELVTEALSDEIIQPLIEIGASNFHLSMATNGHCYIKKSLLDLQNKVIHISPENLIFSKYDIKLFFHDELSLKVLEYVFFMTEGWPIAVQFFSKILDVDTDNKKVEQEFKTNSHLIDMYIIERIIIDFSKEEQKILMEMAISESFDDDLKHYLEINNTVIFSVFIKCISPLIIQLGEEYNKYKFNPIFKECLLQMLEKENLKYFCDIYLKSAVWFAQQGLLKPAIEHCIKANNPQKALEIIEHNGGIFMILIKEGFSYLELILKQLEQCLVNNDNNKAFSDSMTIHLYHFIVNTKSGNKQLADNDYSMILEHYNLIKIHLSAKEQRIIESELFFMKVTLDFNKGKMLIEHDCKHLKRNISQIESDNYNILGQYYNILCLGYLQRGRLTQAQHYAELSINAYKKFNSLFGEIYIYVHLGDIHFAEGKSYSSANLLLKSLHLARRNFSSDKGMISSIQILTVELYYQQGKKTSQNIQLLLKQLEGQEAWFDIYFAGYITSSNIVFEQHGIEEAMAVLNNAEIYLLDKKLNSLVPSLDIQKINILLRANKLIQAKEQMMKANIKLSYYESNSDNIAWREVLLAAVTICKMYLMEDKFSEVISRLEIFYKRALEENNNLSLLHYEILFCIAYQKMNKETLSFSHFEKTLNLYEYSGYIRPFIDHSIDIVILLDGYFSKKYKEVNFQDCPTFNKAKALKRQLSHYLKSIENINIMTKREQEILVQLALGFSNKIIANNINISTNTVCFHLKNIFIKLRASSRLEAVKIAKKRKFISSE